MKNLIIFGVFIIALVMVQFAQAQTVDEVIDKHIAALGGKESLSKLKNITMEGNLTIQGADISVTITQVHNKLIRQDISAMGMNGFDFTTDKDGWSFMPFNGMQKAEPKTADDIKSSLSDLDIEGPLCNYVAKGHKVDLQGKEDVEGTECFKLKVSLASGKTQTYYIDPSSNMIIRSKEMRKVNGQESEMSSDYSDFKVVEGVKMPHSITQPFGTVYISSIKVNQVISDKLYKPE